VFNVDSVFTPSAKDMFELRFRGVGWVGMAFLISKDVLVSLLDLDSVVVVVVVVDVDEDVDGEVKEEGRIAEVLGEDMFLGRGWEKGGMFDWFWGRLDI